ncbi:MAG: hypothetical protein U0768_15140 [Anaerolineae bacterium]
MSDNTADAIIMEKINRLSNERQTIWRKGSLGAMERRRIDEITRELEQLWNERRIEMAARHRSAAPGEGERPGM